MRKTFVHYLGIALGILSAVNAVITDPTNKVHMAVFGAGGLVTIVGSIIAGLSHSKAVNVATITSAGSQFAAKLPQIEADLSTVSSFVQQEWPATKTAIAQVQNRVGAVEQSVQGLAPASLVAQTKTAVISELATAANNVAPPAA